MNLSEQWVDGEDRHLSFDIINNLNSAGPTFDVTQCVGDNEPTPYN